MYIIIQSLRELRQAKLVHVVSTSRSLGGLQRGLSGPWASLGVCEGPRAVGSWGVLGFPGIPLKVPEGPWGVFRGPLGWSWGVPGSRCFCHRPLCHIYKRNIYFVVISPRATSAIDRHL